MNYGDIIEYIDGTRDLKFEEAQEWCKNNNATFDERLDLRDLPKRFFQINEIILPDPTYDDIKEMRANAYREEVDPITSHIQRLRDKEQTEEIITKINELIAERDEKVQEIVEKYPYPVDNLENIE